MIRLDVNPDAPYEARGEEALWGFVAGDVVDLGEIL